MSDKAKGLRVSSERRIGELGVRCLGTLNRGQGSRQQSHIGRRADLYGGLLLLPVGDYRKTSLRRCLGVIVGWLMSSSLRFPIAIARTGRYLS